MTETLLRTEGLTRHFKGGKLLSRQTLHAVDDVDLSSATVLLQGKGAAIAAPRGFREGNEVEALWRR